MIPYFGSYQNVSRETYSNDSQARCKYFERHTRRIKAERKGRRAEFLSRLVLQLKGYTILASRYKTPLGEIDIVAKRANVLAIIEVKARPTKELALESLRLPQFKKIQKATQWFLSHHPKLTSLQIRFDIILVQPFGWVHHQNIWFSENGV